MSRVNHYADVAGIPSLAVGMYQAARVRKGGLKALAIDMEMDYDLLQAKLNPSKAQYLSPEELERFLGLACSNDLLLAISKASGGVVCRPIPMASTADRYRAVSLLNAKSSELYLFLAQVHERNDALEADLYPRLERLLMEYAQIVLGIVHGANECAKVGDHLNAVCHEPVS